MAVPGILETLPGLCSSTDMLLSMHTYPLPCIACLRTTPRLFFIRSKSWLDPPCGMGCIGWLTWDGCCGMRGPPGGLGWGLDVHRAEEDDHEQHPKHRWHEEAWPAPGGEGISSEGTMLWDRSLLWGFRSAWGWDEDLGMGGLTMGMGVWVWG